MVFCGAECVATDDGSGLGSSAMAFQGIFSRISLQDWSTAVQWQLFRAFVEMVGLNDAPSLVVPRNNTQGESTHAGMELRQECV